MPTFSITSDELREIRLFISNKIEKAKKRIEEKGEQLFGHIYYLKLSNGVSKEVTYLNNKGLILLPTYNVNHELLSAMIIPTRGFSYVDSKILSDEYVNKFCAVFTLSVGFIKLNHNEDFPLITQLDTNKSNFLDVLEKFYPTGVKIKDNNTPIFTDENIELIDWLFEALEKITDKKESRKINNILFSYYAALESQPINRTMSLVALVACMDAISKIFITKKCNSRERIVRLLKTLLNVKPDDNSLERWSKRIYNDHRSSYVHGANHKFESYSQNMDGNKSAGLPKALPTQEKPVGKQYEYENDFDIALEVTKFLIFECVKKLSGNPFPQSLDFSEINFSMASNSEAYIGMVNEGWFLAMKATETSETEAIIKSKSITYRDLLGVLYNQIRLSIKNRNLKYKEGNSPVSFGERHRRAPIVDKKIQQRQK